MKVNDYNFNNLDFSDSLYNNIFKTRQLGV